MPQEWMSLSKVAEVLGVHPSTVRNWSDQGVLPVHRTQGGHRRYLRSEVELWMQSKRADGPADLNRVVQNALRSTRMHISEGALVHESWYTRLDEDARDGYRMSGRSLLQGLINYMSSDMHSGISEAEALGYEYASRGRRYDLSSAEAARAFLFFRTLLIEAMLGVYEGAAVGTPSAWSEMYREVNRFTDRILITLLETYETYQRAHL